MICPKCGSACEDDLVFCTKCGTKLRSFTSERISNAKKNVEKETGADTPFENMIGGIDRSEESPAGRGGSRMVIDGSKKTEQLGDETSDGLHETLQEKEYASTAMPNYRNNKKSQTYRSTQKKKKKSHGVLKRLLVVLVAIASVAAAVLITLHVKETTMTEKFDRYYKQGSGFYDAGNYKDAKTQFVNAAKNAFTNEQKIKAYEMVYKIDAQIGGYDEEEIRYLESLVELDNTNIEYFKDLIILYQNNDMASKINTLIASASENIQEELKEFDGTIPVASVAEGTYDKPIVVELTATDDVIIYYTKDGTNVIDSATKKEYVRSIKLNEEGKYTIRAYSVDKNGKSSKEMIVRYTLDFGRVNEPKVSLDSGRYTEYQPKKIKVTADAGCTIYYTEDGTVPTKKSKKYKKAFKLPKGNSLYYFVAINEDGIVSDVVTRAYEYAPQYPYDYTSSLNALTNALISNGTLENKYGEFANGDVAYLEYNAAKDIDDDYYYIIVCAIEDQNGATISNKYYAVSASTGQCYKASGSGDAYTLKSLNGGGGDTEE